MPERKLPTLADAQRQVWVRGIIGGLLICLPVIFLVLFFVKYLYLSLPYDPFLLPTGKSLRGLIDSLLGASAVLALLWRAIPPWQPRPIVPTAPLWNYLYIWWGAFVVMVLGWLLLRSALAKRYSHLVLCPLREAYNVVGRQDAISTNEYGSHGIH